MRETHFALRDGDGIVITYTFGFSFFGKNISFIKFVLTPNSSIGWHSHIRSKELYISFSNHIRFNDSEEKKVFNFFKEKQRHSVKNISPTAYAKIYAIKF